MQYKSIDFVNTYFSKCKKGLIFWSDVFSIFSESAGVKAQINQLYFNKGPHVGALIKQKFCLFRDHVICNLQSTSWNEIICKGAFTISYVPAFSRDLLHFVLVLMFHKYLVKAEDHENMNATTKNNCF